MTQSSRRFEDIAVQFDCEGLRLFGVLSQPAEPGRRGVLLVVGGPQYRVGSHRQFTLLARDLAAGLDGELGRLEYRNFPDGESYVRLAGDPRGRELGGSSGRGDARDPDRGARALRPRGP